MNKEKTLPEIIEHLQEVMPSHIEGDELAAFILSILQGYFEAEEVTLFLRGVADVCETNADQIRMFADVAKEP